jgi:glycosyltransferase involved in cell wall biosynthesis
MLWADRVLIQECLLLAPVLWLRRLGKPRRLLFDFSDPVDTIGQGLRNRLQRLGFAINTRAADHVMVENGAYVAELQRRGLAASQFYGPVDAERYRAAAVQVRATQPAGGPVRIGWTGSPGTLSFITPLFPALDALAQRQAISLMLIGVQSVPYTFRHLQVELVRWTEADEFQRVPSFDLGLFALDESPRSERRGAGKLFVYMASGVPFIATDRGIAHDLMAESGVGFAVATPADWETVLERAVLAVDERQRMAAQGQRHALATMSYQGYRRALVSDLGL